MKKILTLALLALCMCMNAQVDKKYSFGASLGLTIAGIDGHVEKTESKPLPQAGVFMEARLWRKLFLQTGITYTMQGGTYTPRVTEGSTATVLERDVTANYIAIPVKARLYIEKNIFFELGIQGHFLANSKIDETIALDNGEIYSQKSGLKVRPFDLTPVMAVGWRFANNWAAQASVTTGRLNMFVNDGPAKVHHKGAAIIVSYYF